VANGTLRDVGDDGVGDLGAARDAALLLRSEGTAEPPSVDGTSARAHGDELASRALGRLVEELRAEVDGLRTALRYRAVIEQAKGVIVARTGVLPDEAFRRLVRRSQERNRKVTAVAAGVVAHAIQHAEGRGRVDDEVPGDDVAVELASAAFHAAPDVRALTRTVLEELDDVDVAAAVLFATTPDGSLRMLDRAGLDRASARGWERIPLTADVPLTEAARTARPVLLPDRASRLRAYPGSRRVPSAAEATASLPLLDGERVVGVLGLTWADPIAFDDVLTDRLLATATRCAPELRALLRHGADDVDGAYLEPGYERWFHDVLDDLPVPAVVLEPVREDGHVVDLAVVHANPLADAERSADVSILTARPLLAATPVLTRAREVLEGGPPWHVERFEVPASSSDPTRILTDVRLTRLGSCLFGTWVTTRTGSGSAEGTAGQG
jgi:hypothetical protein